MTTNKITRFFDVQTRSAEQDENKMIIEGYALKFEKETELFKGFHEVIKKGAFDKTDMSRVFLLFNHDANKVLAGTTNKSLELYIDDVGLKFVAELVDTPTSKEVYTLAKKGLLTKCSFSFTCANGGYTYKEFDDYDLGEIVDVEVLYDVALVTYPAYDDTEAYARDKKHIEIVKENHKKAKELEERMKKLEWI